MSEEDAQSRRRQNWDKICQSIPNPFSKLPVNGTLCVHHVCGFQHAAFLRADMCRSNHLFAVRVACGVRLSPHIFLWSGGSITDFHRLVKTIPPTCPLLLDARHCAIQQVFSHWSVCMPFTHDCLFYLFSIILLGWTFYDGYAQWCESLVLLGGAVVFVTSVYFTSTFKFSWYAVRVVEIPVPVSSVYSWKVCPLTAGRHRSSGSRCCGATGVADPCNTVLCTRPLLADTCANVMTDSEAPDGMCSRNMDVERSTHTNLLEPPARVDTTSVRFNLAYTPTSIDWSQLGATTPVKDQRQRGPFWNFSTTGASSLPSTFSTWLEELWKNWRCNTSSRATKQLEDAMAEACPLPPTAWTMLAVLPVAQTIP